MPKDALTVTGIYGKLPSRGDFIGRHLLRSFTDPWDQWLQYSLAESRNRLGDGWLECYLTSPLWRFALSAGVCGPDSRIGILMPSVDKVGRYFPLTLTASLSGRPTAGLGALDWFQQAEALILTALEDDLDLEHFIDQVAALRVPELGTTITAPAGSSPAWHYRLASTDELGHACEALNGILLEQCYDGYSLWWSNGSEHIDPCMLVCPQLPSGERFTGLLAGDWTRFGWSDDSINGGVSPDSGHAGPTSIEESL